MGQLRKAMIPILVIGVLHWYDMCPYLPQLLQKIEVPVLVVDDVGANAGFKKEEDGFPLEEDTTEE